MCGSSDTQLNAGCAMPIGIAQIVTGILSIILSFATVNYYAIPAIFLLLDGIFIKLDRHGYRLRRDKYHLVSPRVNHLPHTRLYVYGPSSFPLPYLN